MTDNQKQRTPIELFAPYIKKVEASTMAANKILEIISLLDIQYVEELEACEQLILSGQELYCVKMREALIAFRKDHPTSAVSSSGRSLVDTRVWWEKNQEKLEENLLKVFAHAGIEASEPIRADVERLVRTVRRHLKFDCE